MENPVMVQFALQSALDLDGVLIPARQIIRNVCTWQYRGDGCFYNGGPVADENDNPTTDPNKDRCSRRLSGCKKRFGNNGVLPFGSFHIGPYLMTPILLSAELEQAIRDHAAECYPNESCGLVVEVESALAYWPCRNISPKPLDTFIMHPGDFADAEDTGKIVAMVHSHPDAQPYPSDHDRMICNQTKLLASSSPATAAWPTGTFTSICRQLPALPDRPAVRPQGH